MIAESGHHVRLIQRCLIEQCQLAPDTHALSELSYMGILVEDSRQVVGARGRCLQGNNISEVPNLVTV